LPSGSEVTLHSKRLDKYGRAVAFVTTGDGLDVGTRMLDSNNAVAVDADMKPAPYAPLLGLIKPETEV
jgi:endonuclease YncB( thermonuclease family)